ncbi:MAG: NAD kinase [Saprospiraceae bacterium]|nr:NAD kinase [Saprospiraceae bacterium]
MKFFIYSKLLKENDKQYVQDLLDVMNEQNIEYAVLGSYAVQLKDQGVISRELKLVDNYEELKAFQPDLVMTLGGDGTILSAIEIVRDSGFPIMGVNLGRLGFLSSIEKVKIKEVVIAVVRGDFYTEPRAMLSLDCNLPIFENLPYALNDFTLHKRDTSSMVTIHTYVNDRFLNSYWADGIVVSTATGSTGYSLSCGGPIIFPTSGNIVITPVAPHNLNVRPIVLSENSKISFEIEGRSENFLCTLDSRYETITSEHRINIQKSDFNIHLAHPNDITFMKTIRNKLMWGLDKRNH